MDEYQLKCECGAVLAVHSGQCGLDLPCHFRACPVHVPPLRQLKVQAGDPYPELGLLEKLAVTLLRRERPFDGRCHRCGAPAAYAVPTEFTFLEERIVSGDEGIVITPLFSMATVGASEEHWRTLNVPLAFCQGCRRTFVFGTTCEQGAPDVRNQPIDRCGRTVGRRARCDAPAIVH